MRKSFALFIGLVVCYCGVASAQVREEWVVRHDGLASQGDGARHIAVDKWGNVYVTGGTCTLIWTDNPEFGCTGGAWTTLKYDADGNKLWSASYGGPANFAGSPAGVAVDSAGNVYVTGSMCLYAVFDWVSLWCSGTDYTTIKYGTNGNQLWVAHYASPVDDAGASAMVVDAAGNVHVTGSSMGVDYAYDYVTIKYDTNGNQLWLARYNGPENGGDSAYAIALGAAGAVYVTGYSGGTASTETATIKYDANGNQMWAARSGEDAAVAIAVKAGSVYVTGLATVKYDEEGHELWVARNNAPGIFRANALAVDGSGNAYVTGGRWGAGTSPDYETIRYDTDGNERWVARYNGPGDGYDWAGAIVLDPSRNVYVTGQSDGTVTSADYATIKYDNDGNELWVARYDGPGNGFDVAAAIVLGASSNVYITGFSWGIDTKFDYATIRYSQTPPPTVTVTGGTFAYDGSPHKASATARGIDGLPVAGTFAFDYTPGGAAAPTAPGTYLVTVTFTSADSNYLNGASNGTLTIAPIVVPAPGPTSPVSPVGSIATSTPTFSWSAVGAATYYALSVTDANTAAPMLMWYTPALAGCASGVGTCTVAAPRALLAGLVSWKVITWNPSGYGPWSTTATLVVSVPDPATPTPKPVAPSGAIATHTPTYVWQAVSGATNWYQLSVTDVLDIVHDFWYTPAAACTATLCSHSPNVLLPIGPAQWRVRAFSGLGAGAWSADTSFEAADTAPGKATLVAPVISALTSTPVFTWNAVLGASYYLLRLVDRDNVTVERWYRPADAGCSLGTGICSASPGALKPGPANWQVLTWNGSGYGPWSNRHDFVVEVTDPLAPTLTAMNPSGVIATTHPTYTWTAAAGVTAYRLSIRNKGGQPVYSWYTPTAAGCTTAPTCSATPQAGLQNGTTDEWQVQAWTTVGSGPWTAPVVFTVSIAVPRPIPSADQQVSAVRLVEYGWDSPRPEFVRAHIADMERRPFNGVVMRLPDGGGDVFRPEAWDADKLASQLPILRDIRWQTFDSNFLAMYAASSMDWYDDADWRVVLEHAAFMARAAREGRCKGLMFDPEPYGPSPWTYSEQLHASAHTFSEYEAVVRERGRAFMRALEQEYPGLELLTFYSYSYFLRASAAPDLHTRETVLKDHAWGLLPAFLNGMLEEVDSNMQIIDGHEQSYYAQRPEDFEKAASEVREGAFPWVPSELWDSYARHVQGAQPLYLDWIFGYFKTSAPSLGDGLSDDQRAQLAEHHAYYAMKNVDRYVWVYSEKMNWWTGERLPPGAEDALRSAQRKFRAGENLGFDLTSISESTP